MRRQPEQAGDLARRGDLLQRLALCYSNHFDDYEGALSITHEALSDHITTANMTGVGRSLVDRGIWYFHLRQHQASLAALQRALEVLPPSEYRNRYSSFEYMALNFRALRLPNKMYAAIEKAATFDVEPLHCLTLVWLKGSIAAVEGMYGKGAVARQEVVACRESAYGRFLPCVRIVLGLLLPLNTRAQNEKGALGRTPAARRWLDRTCNEE